MTDLKITAYLKQVCGWSGGVRAVFEKYGLKYDEKEITQNPAYYREMVQKTGQQLSPCVEINGVMLADVSGDEVEAYMLKQGLVKSGAKPAAVPTDRGCQSDVHADFQD